MVEAQRTPKTPKAQGMAEAQWLTFVPEPQPCEGSTARVQEVAATGDEGETVVALEGLHEAAEEAPECFDAHAAVSFSLAAAEDFAKEGD